MTGTTPPDPDFWVFGYGSLMWNPGFAFEERQPGQIFGHHRALCILSTQYRGREGRPGLVLGLDRGGSCAGVAFRVAPQHINDTLAYLEDREQITQVYCPHFACVHLTDGRKVRGYTFVARTDNPQYVHLPFDEQARLVASGEGARGTAFDYLANTVRHMDDLGIQDSDLHKVLGAARRLRGVSA